MQFSLLAVCTLIAAAAAAPASSISKRHVVHEKRSSLPMHWKRSAKMSSSSTIPMRFGLTQTNLDKAEEYLLDVSHPHSPNYGKHWSAKQVAETFRPSTEAVDAVSRWLEEAGISGHKQSSSLGWIDAEMTVEQAERLLQTTYYEYEHALGKKHFACEHYSIPEDVKEHIDIILPTVHFDVKVGQPKKRSLPGQLEKRRSAAADSETNTDVAKDIGKPGKSIANPKKGAKISPSVSAAVECNEEITPACLRALYNFTADYAAADGNSYGIVEYTPQAYLQADLNSFFSEYSSDLVGSSPTFVSIDGGDLQTEYESFDYNGESDLDLEYAMTIVYPQEVTLYQVGDEVEGASFNNFLDALDASYCTYEGGDDSTADGIYPDPYGGGYEDAEDCGGATMANVISTSYGSNEADLTAFYMNRQCNEYMKLGLQGTTFLYSSGDYGVAGNEGECINPSTGEDTGEDADYGKFNPSFPATCPYVLAVGATQVKPSVTNVASTTSPEEAAESDIYSGGGFSNIFALPSYQSDAVATYFADHKPSYTSSRYNNSQSTRGFPDVSANGVNYVVAVDGDFYLVSGTSCSSPVFGSLLTIINGERLAAGKSTIGFANPVFYTYPDILTDITEGGNQGCGTDGFTAVEGWDPVTGMGTPKFGAMLELWLSLP